MYEHVEEIGPISGSCLGRCIKGHLACIVHPHAHKVK